MRQGDASFIPAGDAESHIQPMRPELSCETLRRWEAVAMKQIQVSKRHRQSGWWLDPLPADPRDPDVVRVKEMDRRSRTSPRRSRHPRREPA